MKLNEETKNKIALESAMSISNICRLHEVDFMGLSEKHRSLFLDIFLGGMRETIKTIQVGYEYNKPSPKTYEKN